MSDRSGQAPDAHTTWLDCLFGAPCPVALSVGPDDPRIRIFRDSPYVGLMFSSDPFARMLYRDWRELSCWSQVLLHGLPPKGNRPKPVSLRQIAANARLSLPSVVTILAQAQTAGALEKRRSDEDRRRLIVVPSARMMLFVDEVCARWCLSAASFCGRDSAWGRLDTADRLSLQRVLCIVASENYRQFPNTTRLFDRKTFVFAMLDLLVDPGQSKAGFVAAASLHMNVTRQTIRNILARAMQTGWLASGDPLTLSAMGEARICAALSLIDSRWNSLLDALDIPGRIREVDAAMTARFHAAQA